MHKDVIDRDRAELHSHLGSSVSVEVLWELAHEQGIRLPVKGYDDFERMITMGENEKNKDLSEMDKNYFYWTELIQSSPYAVREGIKQAIGMNYRKSNLVLQELRFNPMKRNKRGEIDLDNIIVSAIHGLDKAKLQYSKVEAGLIISMDRGTTLQKNTIVLEKAIKYKEKGVVGIDIAGPFNKNFKMSDYKDIFSRAKKAGLGITIHTGEEGDIEELRYVVEEIQPHRIGHGILAVKDKKIIDKIVENDIVLEICPTSNLKNSKVSGVDELKEIIRTLIDNNVKLTLNTDGAVMYNISLLKEEKLLLENDIVSEVELNEMYKNAFDYTFIKK